MRKMVLTALAATMLGGSAQATVYSFTLGAGTDGSFTTGAASLSDAGYYLISEIRFANLAAYDTDNNTQYYLTNQVATSYGTLAAYNPATMEFINHDNGASYSDTGRISAQGFFALDGFEKGANYYIGYLSSSFDHFVVGTSISSQTIQVTAPPAVPEPASWAMMIAGVGAIGATMRRRKVAVRFA